MEDTVDHVATWVIAVFRDQQFSSLTELEAAISEWMDAYDRQPFQKRPGSRHSVFIAISSPHQGMSNSGPMTRQPPWAQ